MITVLHTFCTCTQQESSKKLPSRARWHGIYIIENCRRAPAGNDTIGGQSTKVRLSMLYDDIEMFATTCIKGHIHVIIGLYNI